MIRPLDDGNALKVEHHEVGCASTGRRSVKRPGLVIVTPDGSVSGTEKDALYLPD